MASYLYAIVRDDAAGKVDLQARGIDGAPIRAVSGAGLRGLVSTVDAEQFARTREGGDADLRWLEAVARAHDDVVRAIAGRTPTVPLRLGVVCHDDDAVADRLRETADVVSGLLDRVAGHEEWGVKIFAAAPSRQPVPSATPTSGTAYLQQRREALRRDAQASNVGVAEAEHVVTELLSLAAALRRHPPQDPRLSGARAPMVANVAFLVRTVDRDRFCDRARRLQEEQPGLDIETTGPWPAYSFTADDAP